MPYGVLEISSTTQRGYDPQDTDFLTAIANIIAATVAAARRNTALRIALDHMQDLVDDKRRLSANNSLILDKKISSWTELIICCRICDIDFALIFSSFMGRWPIYFALPQTRVLRRASM